MSKILVLVIATVVLILCWILQIAFWWHYNRTFSSYRVHEKNQLTPKVCVLICAKNEEENLPKCLNSIFNQDYSYFDLLVMDDYSHDGTAQVLKKYQQHHKNLFIHRPSQNITGKKLAIQEGVRLTDADWILMTDADCVPRSTFWIKNMMSAIQNKDTDLVLGFGGYKRQKTLLNMFIRYETVYIALQYFSAAIKGNTYMGVGRNIAFKKKTFIDKKPFKNNRMGPGDDDAIVQAISNKKNTSICLNQKAHTISTPKTSFSKYFHQKRRHLSPVKSHTHQQQFILAFLGFSHLGVFILTLFVCSAGFWKFGLALLLIRWVFMVVFAHNLFLLFGEKNLLRILPLADIFLALFYFFQLLCIPFPKKQW
ncbi:MAG: glycosyltransferase [Saprospiraceae bacterium]|nr:glycosyltransferase [Saprospiraceae bacterium]|tara:strand:+ start:3729 stop:4829 length:1101 start_codon:yes stop_codon:yes gene_type:complete